MNRRILPLSVCALVLAAASTFGQHGAAPTPVPAAPAAAPAPASPIHVTGTVAALASDHLELSAVGVVGESQDVTPSLEGQTVDFTFDLTTEKPGDLKVGDRVDLWFQEIAGIRRADRIVVAPAPSAPAESSVAAPAPAGAAVQPSSPPQAEPADQPAATSGAPQAPATAKAAAPRPHPAANAANAAKTASRSAGAVEALRDAASVRMPAQSNPTAGGSARQAPSTTVPEGAVAVTGTVGQASATEGAPAESAGAPAELAPGTATQPETPEHAAAERVGVGFDLGDLWQSGLAAVLVVAAAIVVLVFARRRKNAFVTIDLSHGHPIH